MKSDSHSGKAYHTIRKKILSNQLQPGMRLKEDAWAKKLSVGRMAIREALTRLLGENLVIMGEKAGYFVKPMTPDDVHDIRELREILELGALRLAHRKMDKKKIERLEKICDDFTSMVEQGYFGGACEADMKFHETLMEMAGNQKLYDTYQNSHIPLFHQRLGKAQAHTDDYSITDKEHRQIVKSLKAGNVKQAEEMLIKHFARGESIVLELD